MGVKTTFCWVGVEEDVGDVRNARSALSGTAVNCFAGTRHKKY